MSVSLLTGREQSFDLLLGLGINTEFVEALLGCLLDAVDTLGTFSVQRAFSQDCSDLLTGSAQYLVSRGLGLFSLGDGSRIYLFSIQPHLNLGLLNPWLQVRFLFDRS